MVWTLQLQTVIDFHGTRDRKASGPRNLEVLLENSTERHISEYEREGMSNVEIEAFSHALP